MNKSIFFCLLVVSALAICDGTQSYCSASANHCSSSFCSDCIVEGHDCAYTGTELSSYLTTATNAQEECEALCDAIGAYPMAAHAACYAGPGYNVESTMSSYLYLFSLLKAKTTNSNLDSWGTSCRSQESNYDSYPDISCADISGMVDDVMNGVSTDCLFDA